MDMGAGTLRAAEFEPTSSGVRLVRFGVKPLGLEGASERARPKALEKAITELFDEAGFQAKTALLAAPGFQVLSKPVRIPKVDNTKVAQLIQFEAAQNIPFPLEEAAWDHYTMGIAKTGEIEVLISALKSEVANGIIDLVKARGVNVELIDTAQAALVNAFRYNYGELEGCSMVLDIGAKTTHVLFFEGEKFFFRTINIGANSITQEFATETKMRFSQAEEIKLQKGLVGLGGAYAEPDDPHEAALSKIARQVMTRMHVQVNQTIQFWQKQQGGSEPVRLFLHGGATIMPYLPEFLAEKLQVPIEYFNVFQGMEIGEEVDVAALEKVGHTFGQLAGLSVREVANCPLEMNLMPGSARTQQELHRKKPYFYAAAACFVAAIWAGVYFNKTVLAAQKAEVDQLTELGIKYKSPKSTLKKTLDEVGEKIDEAVQFNEWIDERFLWAEVLTVIRSAMIQTEKSMKDQYGSQVGVWVAAFNSVDADEKDYEDSNMMGMGMGGMYPMGMNPMMMGGMYGPPMGGMPPAGAGEPGNPAGMGMGYPMPGYGMGMPGMGMPGMPGYGMGGDTNVLNVVGSEEKPLRVVCKAIDLRDINPKANLDLKTLLVRNLKTSQMFDYNLTKWGDLDEYEKGNLAEVQADKTDETKARIKTTLFGLDLVLSKPIDL